MFKAATCGHYYIKRQVSDFLRDLVCRTFFIIIIILIAFNKPGSVLVVGCFKLRPSFTLFRVPNIKFNVAKVLQSFISIVDQSVSNYLFMFENFVRVHIAFELNASLFITCVKLFFC